MSSTSNVQDLLVNVVRPTYRYAAETGFVPSLTISNVSEIIAPRIKAQQLAISDSNANTYVGSNAGVSSTNTALNVAIGYSAMGGASNSSNNVAVGVFSLDGLGYSDSNVALGDRTDIIGRGTKNVLIGPNVTMGDGSGNILIGVDLSAGSGNYRFQLGSLLYGDLSSNRVGILTSPGPGVSVDISGLTVFRNKVGIQKTPDYSLDVNGGVNVTDRFYGGPGSAAAPLYSFRSVASGLYQDASAGYGTGAIGISVNNTARVVVTSNKTYIYGDLDVCGGLNAISIGGAGTGGTVASNGTATAPSFTFSNDMSTGFHLPGQGALGFGTRGLLRMCLSGGFLGIGTAEPGHLLDISSSGFVRARISGQDAALLLQDQRVAGPMTVFQNNTEYGIYSSNALPFWLYQANAIRMAISNGNVGIGTTAPGARLDVVTSGTGVTSDMRIRAGEGGSASVTNKAILRFMQTGAGGGPVENGIQFDYGTNYGLSVYGESLAPYVRFDGTNSRMGIGTTAPAYPLHVVGQGHFRDSSLNSGSILVGDTAGSVILSRDAAGNGYLRPQAAANLYLGTSNTNWVTVTATGAVGIARLSPTQRLDVSGNVQATGILVVENTLSNTNNLNLYTSATQAVIESYKRDLSVASFNDILFKTTNDATNVVRMMITGVNGNVGINTSAPSSRLEVVGNIRSTATSGAAFVEVNTSDFANYGLIRANGHLDIYQSGTAIGSLLTSAHRARLSADTGASWITGGLVGIGLRDPSSTLDVSGTLRVTNSAGSLFDIIPSTVYANVTTNGYFTVYKGTKVQSNITVNLSPDAGGNHIFMSNNVGIGTTIPASILDISSTATNPGVVIRNCGLTLSNQAGYGQLKLRGHPTENSIYIEDTSAATYNGWLVGTQSTTLGANARFGITRVNAGAVQSSVPFMIDASSGSVGIGTTTPAYKLHVAGQGHFRDAGANSGSIYIGDTAGSVILQRDSLGNGYLRPQASATLYLGTSNTNWVQITAGGLVGINRVPVTYRLEVGGEAYKTDGNGSWIFGSDARIKQNIERADISLCYSIVKNLHLRRFTWDASYMPNIRDRNSVGWIAQEIETVFPRAITVMSDFGFDDFRAVNDDQILKTMYGAFEKVIADKEALEAKVAAQETLLQSVLARLATLEASQPSSESTPTTLPTPPPPSEPAPEPQPELQPQPSSEYVLVPEAPAA